MTQNKARVKRHWHVLVLALIIALASFFRLWHLNQLPYALHDDEVWNAYLGKFIILNHQDVNGQKWPWLYSDKFGDYPPVLPMYLSGLTAIFFGDNALAVRLPIAICGIINVITVYFLAKFLFADTRAALVATLFMAICPWHVILSRATAENIVATSVFSLGILVLFTALEKQKVSGKLLVSLLLLLTTYLLYPSYRVLIPLFLLPTFLLTPPKSLIRQCMVTATIVAFGLTFIIGHTDWGKGRYDQISIWTHGGEIAGKSLNYSLALGPGRVLEARIFNNKYVLVAREFLRQYSTYFSAQFLAGEGFMEPKRYHLIEHGVAYWSLILVIILFVLVQIVRPYTLPQLSATFKRQRWRYFLLLLWFLLIAPLPAALTLEEVPNIHRTLGMVVVWSLLFGWLTCRLLAAKLTRHWLMIAAVGLGLVFCSEAIYFWHTYTTLDYESNFIYRDDAKKLISEWLLAQHDEKIPILIPQAGNLILHYLFFGGNYDPSLVGQFEDGLSIEVFHHLHPVFDPCKQAQKILKLQPNEKILVVSEQDNCEGLVLRDKIVRHNLTDAYYIWEASREGILPVNEL
ncbi:glycosyltransferase family 39 protein [bacterium]|nr:glycosyltransferase family 39 protein [bacterium]